VREDDDGGRGVAEVGRDGAAEAVGVEEDGVERAVEERGRDGALEVVEAEVEVLEGGQGEHDLREGADEAVVAEVELVEEAEAAECVGDDAAEAVGVEMEEGEVGQAEREGGGQEARDVGVVEVDPGDHERAAAVAAPGSRGAEDAVVGADVGAEPVGGEVGRVGEDGGLLPGLERGVGGPELRVRERPGGRRIEAGGEGRRVLLCHVALLLRRRRCHEQHEREQEWRHRAAARDHA